MIKIGRRTYTREEYERGLQDDWHGDGGAFWWFWGRVIFVVSIVISIAMLLAGVR